MPTFVGVLVLAFLTLFAYGLGRSPIESMFLSRHGADALPSAWIAVAIATIASVWAYDRLARTRPLLGVYGALALISAGALALLAGLAFVDSPGSALALYVWKDVHVVLLLEIVWTIANAVFSIQAARWAYGAFCVAGSLGGFLGNLASGEVGARTGTVVALALPFAVLLLLVPVSRLLASRMGELAPRPRTTEPEPTLALLGRSRYVLGLLVLVLVVQVSITGIDYVYNRAIEDAFPAEADRTRAIGFINAAIDGSSLVLQLATGPLLRFLGLSAVLVSVPAIVGASIAASIVDPRFALTAVTKIASKALDYSVFRAAKEILYIPLDYAEKTHGKALVDMVTYRVAKVVASLLLLAVFASGQVGAVWWVLSAVVIAWLGMAITMARMYRAKVGPGGA